MTSSFPNGPSLAELALADLKALILVMKRDPNQESIANEIQSALNVLADITQNQGLSHSIWALDGLREVVGEMLTTSHDLTRDGASSAAVNVAFAPLLDRFHASVSAI